MTRKSRLTDWSYMSPLVFGIGFLAAFIVIAMKYWSNQPVRNTLDLHLWEEPVWLSLLFFLPVLFQILVLAFIFRSVSRDSDEVSLRFYKFVSIWTAVGSGAYFFLWLLYPTETKDSAGVMEGLSYFALGLTLFALFPVFKMTYAIMRIGKGASLLKKGDVKSWAPFTNLLRDANEETSPAAWRVVELLKREHPEIAAKLSSAVSIKLKEDDKDLGMAEIYERDLLAALNRITTYPDFYTDDCFRSLVNSSAEKYRSQHDNLLPYEYQAFHLHLLCRLSREAFQKFELDPDIPEGKLGWLERWWLKRSGELRAGAAAHPFWAVSFFFTLMLCITYLLGFAFAFHDKGVEKSNGFPALYKAVIYPGEKEAKLFPTHASGADSLFHMADLKNPAGLADRLRDGKDSLSIYLYSQLSPKTQGELRSRQDPNTLHRLVQKSLVEELNRVLRGPALYNETRFKDVKLTPETQNWVARGAEGEELISLNRVLLEEAYPDEMAKCRNGDARGRTDWMSWPEYRFYFDSGTATFTRSEAGPGQEYEALKKEWRESPKGKRLTAKKLDELKKMDVEWRQQQNDLNFKQFVRAVEKNGDEGRRILVQVKGSTDDPRPDQKTYSSNYELSEARAQNIRYEVSGAFKEKAPPAADWLIVPVSSEAPAKALPSSTEDSFDADLRNESQRVEQTTANEEDKVFLQLMLSRINGSVIPGDDKKELLKNEHDVREQVEYFAAMTAEERAIYKDEVEHAKAALKGAVNLAESVDQKAGRRVVVVSIKLIEADRPAEKQAVPKQFAPLTLMDYMYFTMYTITTTGYGDIMPKTSYAKFLCSLANIIEVFFFVVFFNALLSVRRTGRRGKRRDRRPAVTAG